MGKKQLKKMKIILYQRTGLRNGVRGQSGEYEVGEAQATQVTPYQHWGHCRLVLKFTGVKACSYINFLPLICFLSWSFCPHMYTYVCMFTGAWVHMCACVQKNPLDIGIHPPLLFCLTH